MPYCNNCGKFLEETENFCSACGTKIKNFVDNVEEQTEEVVKKGHKGFVVFIIFLMIIGYVVLDIWAATQIELDTSLSSVGNSILSLKGDTGLTSSSVSTELRLYNPTFVPLFLFPINYEASYGDNQIAKGRTGMIFISPNSESDIPANVEISHIGMTGSVIEGIWDSLTGNPQEIHIDFYELGIKFASMGK